MGVGESWQNHEDVFVGVLVILQLSTVSSVTIGVASIPHLVSPYPYPSLPYLLLGDQPVLSPVVGRQAVPPSVEIRDNGLEIETLSTPVACSREAVSGDRVSVHYTGTLQDGTVFDSSYNRQRPIDFILGSRQVIQGWDEGLLGACIGERRRLVIPPALGYGDKGAGEVIPPGATLVFTVHLVNIEDTQNKEAEEAGFLKT